MMRSLHQNPYVDPSPAGDPTYDPRGTSRPFRPTHRRAVERERPKTYRQIEKRYAPVGSRNRIIEAVKSTIDWEINGRPQISQLDPKVYMGAGIIAGACIILIGVSALSSALLPKGTPLSTSYASAESHSSATANTSTSSAKIAQPQPVVAGKSSRPATNSSATPGIQEINTHTMSLYVAAAHSCNMPWQILAAVGRVETNHGRSDAPGVSSGANYAGAKGPMQFLQSTWDNYGIDADHNGKADIYNETDAIYSAANYLCANGARDSADIGNALYHYNHSGSYVALVQQTAKLYNDSAYFSPIPNGVVSASSLSSPHHDYPAIDIPVDVGTPVFAVHTGTVKQINDGACGWGIELNGTDGIRYIYCHASELLVRNGKVDAGTEIMRSGGATGQAGSGDATGPHLHFAMSENGHNICPQSVLRAWATGAYADPLTAQNTSCTY